MRFDDVSLGNTVIGKEGYEISFGFVIVVSVLSLLPHLCWLVGTAVFG